MSKSKDALAQQAVSDYLVKQNRPYSVIDIFNNLHKEYGKTVVIKCLETLVEEGVIKEKTYGKQKVYVADQSRFADVSDSELKEIDHKIAQLSERLKATESTNHKLESQLSGLNNAITTKEAKVQIRQLSEECEKMRTKLKALKENENSVSPFERARIMTTRSKYIKEWRKRKRVANDILSAIMEGYPKRQKDLYEEIGIETDDDYKVTPPVL